jgi:hypothetical protein
MRAKMLFAAVMFVFGFVLVLPGFGWAGESTGQTSQLVTMKWSFRNNHPNIVCLRFYAQTSNRVWPAPNQCYKLDDGDAHEIGLKCWEGEKICYGAWTDSGRSQWGVGGNGKRGCRDCCATCQSVKLGTRNLNP